MTRHAASAATSLNADCPATHAIIFIGRMIFYYFSARCRVALRRRAISCRMPLHAAARYKCRHRSKMPAACRSTVYFERRTMNGRDGVSSVVMRARIRRSCRYGWDFDGHNTPHFFFPDALGLMILMAFRHDDKPHRRFRRYVTPRLPVSPRARDVCSIVARRGRCRSTSSMLRSALHFFELRMTGYSPAYALEVPTISRFSPALIADWLSCRMADEMRFKRHLLCVTCFSALRLASFQRAAGRLRLSAAIALIRRCRLRCIWRRRRRFSSADASKRGRQGSIARLIHRNHAAIAQAASEYQTFTIAAQMPLISRRHVDSTASFAIFHRAAAMRAASPTRPDRAADDDVSRRGHSESLAAP